MSRSIATLESYRLLRRSGLRISPLCLGWMTFGADWGWGADAPGSTVLRAYAGSDTAM